jgi:sugar lactone lactonase YvrE
MTRRFRLASLVLAIAALLSLGFVGAVGAAAPVTVASGLNGTFILAAGEDGAIYAFDGGAGNTESISPPAGAPADTPPLVRGRTGSIFRIAPNGSRTTVASGLPSYEGFGATGLVVANGFVWANFTVSPAALYGAQPYPEEGYLVKIALAGGAPTRVADIAGYEAANSPQAAAGHPPESNPWGLALGPDGNLYVTDAAGNDLLRVNPTTGAIDLVVLFPGLPGTEPNEARGGRNEADPVPTGVAAAPGGGFFVAHLPGEAGAPPPGSGKVVRVSPTGQLSDYATGFNFAVNLAVGPDSQLYVVELVGGFGPQGPLPGRVTRVRAGGVKEVVADGLNAPGGIAFDRAGNMYISTGTVSFGPPPPTPAGEIVRFDGVAAPPAPPSPSPSAPPSQPPAPPSTGSGGNLPGLPNTGAGGTARSPLPLLPALGLAALVAGGLALRRRLAHAARSR